MNMRTFLMVLAMMPVTWCNGSSLDDRWETFKMVNNRKYKLNVETVRRQIWEDKMKKIEQHNLEADQGVHSYWMRETEWDDLTFDEFMHQNGDFDPNGTPRVKRSSRDGKGDCFNQHMWNDTSPYLFNTVNKLPTNVDWARKGYVTSVKNQGYHCGSCWAFSAVGALEGQWFKKTKTLVTLSPQWLVDCSERNDGCDGGLPERAFEDVKGSQSGIARDEDYPYTEERGNCQLPSPTKGVKNQRIKTINTEKELLNAVATVGPISVGISTGDKFANVGTGIFTDCDGDVNHAVLVVGYGVYNTKKFWKMKNSHGTGWGDEGYFLMTRDRTNACNISSFASYPAIDGADRGSVQTGEVPKLTTTLALILPVCLVLLQCVH